MDETIMNEDDAFAMGSGDEKTQDTTKVENSSQSQPDVRDDDHFTQDLTQNDENTEEDSRFSETSVNRAEMSEFENFLSINEQATASKTEESKSPSSKLLDESVEKDAVIIVEECCDYGIEEILSTEGISDNKDEDAHSGSGEEGGRKSDKEEEDDEDLEENKADGSYKESNISEVIQDDFERMETDDVEEVARPSKRKHKKKKSRKPSSDDEEPVKKKGKSKAFSDNSSNADSDDIKIIEGNESERPLHPMNKSKALPELEKYWKAVNEDPHDFTGWTYLIQYVDQATDVEAAREAYDSFLALYPYCYGYWRKYADYEKRRGNADKCEEVFVRGLKAIPLSVDLWIHYLNFIKTNYPDEETKIREEYDRSIETCGKEFRSDRLWDSYIKWETDKKNLQKVVTLYDELLKIPTQGYKTHLEDFEDFVKSNPPSKLLSVDDFLSLRSEVLQKLRQKPLSKDTKLPPSAAPPGDDEGDDEEPSPGHADEETSLMRDIIISSRTKTYKNTVTAVLARWNFEEGIKRPYFHVKPLERSQLNNWNDYLDFEIADANQDRTVILFERCLIACALYEEFWLKFIKYLQDQPDDMTDKIRDVYQRACCIHHPKKPLLALNWSAFEEGLGNFDQAREILKKIEDIVPNILHVSIRRINFERRCGKLDETTTLYEHYISKAKNKSILVVLSIKYARFCWRFLKDSKKGIQVLRGAIEHDPDNPRLYSQLLELTLMVEPFSEVDCLEIFDEVLEKKTMDLEYKRIFAQRKLEFLEDFGSSLRTLQTAQVDYGNILKKLKDKKRNKNDDKNKMDDGKMKKSDMSSGNPPSPYSNYNQNGTTYGIPSSYQSNSSYNQSSTYNQQQPFNQYNQQDQNYSNYQNWNYSQTTPGYGNYNQNWGGYNYYS